MRNTTETTDETTSNTDVVRTQKSVSKRKVVAADGSVSYGVKADGTPRKKPGRRPKKSVS